jgi:hypothetical protein
MRAGWPSYIKTKPRIEFSSSPVFFLKLTPERASHGWIEKTLVVEGRPRQGTSSSVLFLKLTFAPPSERVRAGVN